MRFQSFIAGSTLLGLLCGAPLARCEPRPVNGIAARVNDSIITFQEVEGLISLQTVRDYWAQYGPDLFQEKLNELRSDALTNLVETKLILHEFTNAGYRLPDNYVDDLARREIRRQFRDRATMTRSGVTYEDFRKQISESLIRNEMQRMNIDSIPILSPYKIESYYNQNIERFKVEDQIRLRMIFLANKPGRNAEETRRLAERILGQVKDGASFADMASSYSDGSQRNLGGDTGWLDRATGVNEEFAEVAFSLEPGQCSDVLETAEGCHLLYVEDARPAHTKPLSEVRPLIEQTLRDEQLRELRQQWIDRLKARAYVTYFPAY